MHFKIGSIQSEYPFYMADRKRWKREGEMQLASLIIFCFISSAGLSESMCLYALDNSSAWKPRK